MKERYFHGGKRGLYVGDFILPPSETQAEVMAGSNNPNYRKDRVYITTNIDAARFFGSGCRGKEVVYEVVPADGPELDPDDKVSNRSFACSKARIIAIHKIPGKVIKKNQKAMLKRAHELEAQKSTKQRSPNG